MPHGTPAPGIPGTRNANLRRDARLRYRMLDALHKQRGNQHGGYVTGRFLTDVAGGYLPAAERPEDDDHALGLLRDLVAKGFAIEEDNREDHHQPFGLDYLTFRITAPGSSFIARSLPADADIDDGRIVKR